MTKAQLARALSFVAVSLGVAGTALAQQPSEAEIAAIRSACRSDYTARRAANG